MRVTDENDLDAGYTTTADVRYHWIQEGGLRSSRFKCSSCDRTVYFNQQTRDKKQGPKILYPYCPYCLAHMSILTGYEGRFDT